MKDLFIAAHEELITEYLEAHPGATEDVACGATADGAMDRMTDKYCARIDYMRDIAKEP